MTRPALGVLAALLALPASAAEREVCRTVALHPVVVNGADTGADHAMVSEIQAVAAAELLKRQRTLQDSSVVSDALSKLPTRECSDNQCLSRLARDTHSDCTAYFAVTPNAGRTVFLSARLIPASDADRPVFSRSEHYDRIGKSPKDWSISALQRFIRTVPLPTKEPIAGVEVLPLLQKSDGARPPPPDGQLPPNLNPPNPKLASPPTPPNPNPVASSPAPSPNNPPPPPGLDWRTPVGGGLAIVGIGAAVAGVVVFRQGDANWQSVLGTREGNPPTFPAARHDEVLEAYRSASSKMTLGTIGMVGGAGMTAAGAGLLLWEILGGPKSPQSASAPASASKVACAPAAGAIRCSITFP
jgi:hypothetical protein